MHSPMPIGGSFGVVRDHENRLPGAVIAKREPASGKFDAVAIRESGSLREAPAIEVHIVESSEPPGGMGECGTSAVVPAMANAIFAATGKRLRKMPIDIAALKQTP